MSEGVTENKVEKPGAASTDLRTNLEEIFEANMDTYAHGTRVEAAEKIISEGLKTKSPDLGGTAIFLFDLEKPFEEQIDGVMKKIENWPHLKSKAIIIIMLPTLKRDIPNTRTELNGGVVEIKGIKDQIRTAPFFRKIPGEHDPSYGLPYILPPNYIKGFVDLKKKEFISSIRHLPLI